MAHNKKQLFIDIPEPCNEKWNNMTPANRGRNCDRCQYEVVDYSRFTDRQLINEFSSNTIKCGRFHKDQLNRVIEINEGGAHISPIRKIAAMVAITAATIVSSPNSSEAQTIPTEQVDSTKIPSNINVENNKISAPIQISGVVLDKESGESLIGATITIKGTKNGTISDFDGNFTIEAPINSTLVFSYVGYESQEVQISNNKDVNIFLEISGHILGGMVIVGGPMTTKRLNKRKARKEKK